MAPLDPAQLVGTGGALGALARYLLGEHVETEEFPVGTFLVNVLGSFVLALLAFSSDGDLLLFLGTGACGSFTTFSSFSFETVRLYETGYRGRAVLNAGGTLLAAGGAIGLAWLLAGAVLH